MSAQWKSTPNYWCKYCSMYVRDTNLERTNHEASGKHQGAVKRFLRTIHKDHEREEREKLAARREIARVTGKWEEFDKAEAAAAATKPAASAKPAPSAAPTPQQLARQREQLAELGVAVPDDFRPEMAIPGEWTVTNTRIIEAKTERSDDKDEDEKKPAEEAKSSTSRKRATSEEMDHEDAVQSLFKKPRRWGRDSRAMPGDEDKELDALLATPFAASAPQNRGHNPSSNEEPADTSIDSSERVKKEEEADDKTGIKLEDGAASEQPVVDPVKKEEQDQEPLVKPEPEAAESGIAPIVFKQKRPKGIRKK